MEYFRVALQLPPYSPTLDMGSLLNFSYSNKYVVVSYGVLICISLLTSNVEYLFLSFFGIDLFGEASTQILFCLLQLFIIQFWEYE